MEDIASELVSAAEALEHEERAYFVDRQPPERRYYTAIVTTADLEVGSFDPTSISLQDGLVPDSATFERVNYVRFRKQLSFRVPERQISLAQISPDEPKDLAHAKERTVFVVRATYLDHFLRVFD